MLPIQLPMQVRATRTAVQSSCGARNRARRLLVFSRGAEGPHREKRATPLTPRPLTAHLARALPWLTASLWRSPHVARRYAPSQNGMRKRCTKDQPLWRNAPQNFVAGANSHSSAFTIDGLPPGQHRFIIKHSRRVVVAQIGWCWHPWQGRCWWKCRLRRLPRCRLCLWFPWCGRPRPTRTLFLVILTVDIAASAATVEVTHWAYSWSTIPLSARYVPRRLPHGMLAIV